jgi:hypothetical protein
MKKTETKKAMKLKLSRETLHAMEHSSLTDVVGGIFTATNCGSNCGTCGSRCC